MPAIVAAPIAESLLAETAIASLMPEMMTAGSTLTSLGAAAADPLLAGLQAGASAYGNVSGIASLLNPTAASPIASAFNPASYLQNSGLGNALPATEAAAPIVNPNQGILDAIRQAPVSPVTDAATQITPTVNAAPESTYNLASRFPGLSESQFPNFQNGQISENLANAAQQQRITTPSLPSVESITAPPVNPYAYNPTPISLSSPEVAAPAEVVNEAPAEVVNEAPAAKAPVAQASANTPADQLPPIEERGRPAGITGMNALNDLKVLASKPNWSNIKDFASEHPYMTGIAGLGAYQLLKPKTPEIKKEASYIRPYSNTRAVSPTASYYTPYSGASTAERNYFTGGLQALPIYRAAEGGLTSLAVGGPIETMSAMNAVGENLGYPQSQYQTDIYSNPNVQRPQATNMIGSESDASVDPYTGEEKFASGGSTGGYKYSYDPAAQKFTQLNDPAAEIAQQAIQPSFNSIGQRFQPQAAVAPKPFTPVTTGGIATPAVQSAQPMQAPMQAAPAPIPAYQTPEQQLGLGGFYDYMNQQLGGMRGYQGFAEGGLSHLGGYSDGGRLLRGPGDGVSDSIPASIGDRQPARLADGEFVVPARVVSEIGNGSTEAGARKLYAMMERVQSARKKSVGKGNVAVNSKADKYLPA